MQDSVVLIIEDDLSLGEMLNSYFSEVGYKCFWATEPKEAKLLFIENVPDIVLMDIGLPETSGLVLAKEFRDLRKDFVLLFLSALNDPEIKVNGLEIGADDYITKPFALKELVYRFQKILKYRNELANLGDQIILGDLKILFKKFQVIDASGGIIDLSHKECEILKILYQNINEVVTRDLIIENVWGKDKFPSQRTVDNYIVKLRRWCDTSHSNNVSIQNVRGVGYKLFHSDINS